jgi:hypothetical protein
MGRDFWKEPIQKIANLNKDAIISGIRSMIPFLKIPSIKTKHQLLARKLLKLTDKLKIGSRGKVNDGREKTKA